VSRPSPFGTGSFDFEGRRGIAISDVNKQTPNENKLLAYSGIRLTPEVNSVTMHKKIPAKICVLKRTFQSFTLLPWTPDQG